MQFTVGRVKTVNGEDITVEWESPLWLRSKSSPPVLITQLDAAPMRIIGVAKSIHSA